MDARQEKGIIIAATTRIRKVKGQYIVPSQTNKKQSYTVSMSEQRCTCPDHVERQVKCKHLYAVEMTVKRETTTGDTKTTETLKVTYSQDWTHYNQAQTNEKVWFTKLLTGLTKDIPQPPQANGRPRLPLSDMVFASTYKVYSLFSSRRFTTDLHEAHHDGLIAVAPHFNSVSNYMADAALTPILKSLIEQSAAPLKSVESDFAVDSTGFSTTTYAPWYDHKWNKTRTRQQWVKTHIMTGVRTHIITAVEATVGESSDVRQLPALVAKTAEQFDVKEVSADKAYSGRKTLQAITTVGAVPFIPFHQHATGLTGHRRRTENDTLWQYAHAYYNYNRREFLDHYYKRNNVETTMFMLKSKFGGAVKSKSPEAQVNEVLCKVLAHNIVVLIHSMYELGIEPAFCAEKLDAQEVHP